MSLLLLVGLISSTSAFYHVLKDSSGTLSYMAQISAISVDSFDLIIYQQSQYSSSPICADCIIFNGTLKTYKIPLSEDTISFHIQLNNIYIFIQCPLLLTISITFPSHNIQYITNTPKRSPNNNDDKLHCVFQQQSDESLNSINYVMYNEHSISLYQYHFPLKSNQFKQNIATPFNTSFIPYIIYSNNILYFIQLTLSNSNTLHIASYNFMDKIWHRNDEILSEIAFDNTLSIQSAGIHRTKNSKLPILNIFFHSNSNHDHNNNNKYEIFSWLINTHIYSIHKYTYNPLNTIPIIINDYNIHIILSNITDTNDHFIYYNNINTFLQQISYTVQYMHISHAKRRRLQHLDSECRDMDQICALVAHDCDDEEIKDLCRATCGQCQQREFNCSDYEPTAQTSDVCDYPRNVPSFCEDPDGWFLYWCPITCKHTNCSQIWMTANPTPTPTIKTTIFESTRADAILITTHDIDMPYTTVNIPTHVHTKKTVIDIDVIEVVEHDKMDTNNDMSLILILLAVLLVCVFVAGILLWICVSVVRLQKDRNIMTYNAMVAMSSRTPEYFTHGGAAPSTPDYFRTELHRHTQKDPLRG